MITLERHVAEQEAQHDYALMLDTLAELYGCEPTEEAIKRRVYKETECGAWIAFPTAQPLGVTIGSIVEGVDGDGVPGVFVPYDPSEPEEVFLERYRETMQDVEVAVDEIWMATHGCEDCPGPAVNPECGTCGGRGVII